jgi:uncharacterized integral membrane protein
MRARPDLRRIFRWAIGLPIVVLVAAFAVANRQSVVLSLDPFHETDPMWSLQLPLWLLFFVGAFVGLIIGYTAAWFAQGRHRRLARERHKEIARLSTALEQAQKTAPQEPKDSVLMPLPGIMP